MVVEGEEVLFWVVWCADMLLKPLGLGFGLALTG